MFLINGPLEFTGIVMRELILKTMNDSHFEMVMTDRWAELTRVEPEPKYRIAVSDMAFLSCILEQLMCCLVRHSLMNSRTQFLFKLSVPLSPFLKMNYLKISVYQQQKIVQV